jgi:hypothetical protein
LENKADDRQNPSNVDDRKAGGSIVISDFKNPGSTCAANPTADLKVADLAVAVNASEIGGM